MGSTNIFATKMNKNIQGLRGVLALGIFFFHIAQSKLPPPPFASTNLARFLLSNLEFCVELFFGISGFVMVGAVKRHSNALHFIWDRLTRIYPVLWITTAIILLLGLITRAKFQGVEPSVMLFSIPASLLAISDLIGLTSINPVSWSLGYEMSFYLLCTAFIASRQYNWRGAIWLLSSVGIAFIVIHPRACFIVSGVLVANGIVGQIGLNPIAKWPLLYITLFFVVWGAISHLSSGHFRQDSLLVWMADSRILLAILGFVLGTMAIASIATDRGIFGRFLDSPPVQWLGSMSYSLYMWHLIAIAPIKLALRSSGLVVAYPEFSWLMLTAAALPVSLVLAAASSMLVENHLGRWLKGGRPVQASEATSLLYVPDVIDQPASNVKPLR